MLDGLLAALFSALLRWAMWFMGLAGGDLEPGVWKIGVDDGT